jgi:hypothetical protein
MDFSKAWRAFQLWTPGIGGFFTILKAHLANPKRDLTRDVTWLKQ